MHVCLLFNFYINLFEMQSNGDREIICALAYSPNSHDYWCQKLHVGLIHGCQDLHGRAVHLALLSQLLEWTQSGWALTGIQLWEAGIEAT